jgi:mRNA interferase MazF
MITRGPRPGDIYLVVFPEHDPRGHGQEGVRPALVLAVPPKPRFPVILAAPLTTDRAQPWVKEAPNLYPRLPGGAGGLPVDSILLLDQTRSIDAARVRRLLGTLNRKAFGPILENWVALFKGQGVSANPKPVLPGQ